MGGRPLPARAGQLPPDVPRILRDGDADRGLATYLTGRASLPLVGALERSGFINRANRTRLLGTDGLLTAEARDDLARMLSAAVLPTEIAERSPELARAVDRSAVAWLVAAGAGPDWDVRPDLAAAALDLLSLRGSQMCLARWRQQVGLERPRTEGRPMAQLLLEILDLSAARPATFAKIAGRFAEASRTGGGLFGGADPLTALREAAAEVGVVAQKAGSTRRCRK